MPRSYGTTKDCNGCRFWSEMIAQAIGGGGVQALCLSDNEAAPNRSKYTYGRDTCSFWKEGALGAVDDPHADNYEAYEALDRTVPEPASEG